MKKTLAILSFLSFVIAICLLPINVQASTIMVLDVKDIALPVVGEKPDFSAELKSLSDVCKITRVEWVEYDEGWEWEKDMTANDTFKEGYWYVVYVYMQTETGHNFGNSVSCTINNQTAKLNGNSTQENGTKASFYVAFQPAKNLTNINRVDLNVVKPVIGKTPTFAKVDTTQYVSEKNGTVSNCSNGVTWTNQSSGVNLTVSNPFKEGVKYKVSYYLTAKDGYKFTTSTQCTINGSAATVQFTDHFHAIVSLSDLLPGDGKREVTALDLNVVTPQDGKKPEYTKIDGVGYYSDNGTNGSSTKIYKNGIAWFKSTTSYISPGTTETFKGGSEYTVKVSLLPKDGYKFSKNVSAKINGKSATVETLDDGSVNVSLKLTALSKEHKHTESDWKSDSQNHWKICTDTACNTIVTAKEAHKMKDDKCSVCGYVISKDTDITTDTTGDSTEPTASDDTTSEKSGKNESKKVDGKGNKGAFVWIILGVVLVLAAGGVVTFIVIGKKKNHAK